MPLYVVHRHIYAILQCHVLTRSTGCRYCRRQVLLFIEHELIKLTVSSIAAALNVTEPASTGIGGDMFCLFYDAKTKKIRSMNGSGRYPANGTLDKIRNDLKIASNESGTIPMSSALSVTVPGAAAGWVDTVDRFGSGKVSLEQILLPAIELAEEGFPVSELSSYFVGFDPLLLEKDSG